MRTPYSLLTEEQKEKKRASVRKYQKQNKEKVSAQRKIYEQSDAGKASKRRCELRYKLSGGRAAAENRRAKNPISEARKAARAKWAKSDEGRAYRAAMQSYRRSIKHNLDEFDAFVLIEAHRLAKMRSLTLGQQWHVDHIVPVSKGGLSNANNLQVVPASWNRRKSNKNANTFWAHKE